MAQKVSDETRAAVVAALCTGQSVTAVAKTYKLGASTVSGYKKTIAPEMLRKVQEQKDFKISDLLMDYIQDNLKALSKQCAVAGDPEYLKKQPAADLALLHGVMVDKAVRLIEAMEMAESAIDADDNTDEVESAE